MKLTQKTHSFNLTLSDYSMTNNEPVPMVFDMHELSGNAQDKSV